MTKKLPDFHFLAEPFDHDLDAEVVEKVCQIFKKAVDDGETYSTANALPFNRKGEVETQFGRACHAFVGSTEAYFRYGIITENGARRNLSIEQKTVVEPFLKWFLYDSFLSPFIFNRDDYDYCRDYGFVVSGNVPQPLFQAIMIISRHFYECSLQAFKKFNELTEKQGVDPFLAYCLAFNTVWSAKSQVEGSNTVTNKYNHRAFHSVSFEMLENYYNGKCATESLTKSYKSNPSTGNVSCLFNNEQKIVRMGRHIGCEQFREPCNSRLTDALLTFRAERDGKEKEGYRPPNPFTKSNNPSNLAERTMTYDEYFSFFVSFLVKEGIVPPYVK